MPVAKVVGGTGEELRAVGDCLDELFLRGEDFDNGRAVFGHQFVAAAQVVATLEEDAGLGAGSERYLEAAALSFVVGEGDRVGGWLLRASVQN